MLTPNPRQLLPVIFGTDCLTGELTAEGHGCKPKCLQPDEETGDASKIPLISKTAFTALSAPG